MSDWNIDSIIDRLQDRFNDEWNKIAWPVKRVIVFWYDPKRSYEDWVENLKLTCKWKEVKILKVKSYFQTKYILEKEDLESNYLVYIPEEEPLQPNENWLEDIRLYSGRFKADKLTVDIEECWINSTDNLSSEDIYLWLLEYSDFFDNKQRKEKFKEYYALLNSSEKWDMHFIYLCMIAACVKAQDSSFRSILIQLFWWENDEENEKWKSIKISNMERRFWMIAEREYWYFTAWEPSLKDLLYKIIFWWMYYKAPNLKIWKDKKHAEFLKDQNWEVSLTSNKFIKAHSFLEYWLSNEKGREIFRFLENDFFTNRKLNYESFVEDLEKWTEITRIFFLSKIDEYVIRFLKSKFNSNDFNKAEDIIKSRKNTLWYSEYENEYNFIYYGNLFRKDLYEIQLTETKSDEMRNNYVNNYYKVDFHYRKCLASYHTLSIESRIESQNLFKEALEYYNNTYAEWLYELNNRRYKLLESENFKSDWGKLASKKQWNFWNDYVLWNLKPNWKYWKILVIISDAFRYEAAKDLSERLPLTVPCEYEIHAIQSTLPSFTKLWMAALLPHDDLHFHNTEKQWDIDSWNTPTWSLKDRNQILNSAYENSIAIKYDEFKTKKQNEQRSLLQGKNVVYVYHDIIDANANGDNVPLETENCINDLVNIVKTFSYSPFNFSRILITADHWYLYQMNPLDETDKSRKTISSLNDTARFAIGETTELEKEKLTNNTNDFIVHLDYIWEKNLSVCTPWADSRYKRSWEYKKFDHWWATLQEIVVPVIEYLYKWKWKDSIKYATISLKTIPSSVTTNSFSITVTQDDIVDNQNILTWEYNIVIRKYTSKEPVSSVIPFIADKKSSLPSERQTQVPVEILPVTIEKDELCEIHIEAKDTVKNNYEVDYPIKINIWIQNEFWF